MRFVEVTSTMATARVAITDAPDHPAHGKRLLDEIPTLGNQRIWRATHGGYSWCIAYEPGLPQWNEDGRRQWIGYSASYRKLGQNGMDNTIMIDGGPWLTFVQAETACRQRWRAVRGAN